MLIQNFTDPDIHKDQIINEQTFFVKDKRILNKHNLLFESFNRSLTNSIHWYSIYQIKKPDCILQSGFNLGAQNKTRTCTPLRAPAPQAGVSTNFTIWAGNKIKDKSIKIKVLCVFILFVFCLFLVPRTGLEPAHHY